jgi:NitT/TauT family transport system substrate-binding protein
MGFRAGRWHIAAALALLGAAPVVPAAAQSGSGTAVGNLASVSINLSWVPTTANQLPFFLAKSRGLFASEGLDVSLVPGRGSAQTAQAVGAGRYDVAQADLTTMALLRGKGAPVKAFLVQFPRTSFGCVGAKDANIASWKDLEGKKVGVTQGAPETYLLPATFKKLGLDLNRVDRINVPAPNKNTTYLSKQIDALCTDVASEMPVLNLGRPLNPLWFGEVLDVPYHGLFARDELFQTKPAVVRGVAKAVAGATKAMVGRRDVMFEAARALAEVNPPGSLNLDNLVSAWELYARFQVSGSTRDLAPGSMSRVDWQRTLDLIREYAAFDGSMNPDEYFTNDFVPK